MFQETGIIRQRRAATGGLCGENKEVPLSVMSWSEAKKNILLWRPLGKWKLCQLGMVRLTAVCVCVFMYSGERKDQKRMLLFDLSKKHLLMINTGAAAEVCRCHSDSAKYIPFL